MEIRYDDQIVIVTGGSMGIGEATAVEFAKCGASVVVNYNISEKEALAVVKQIEANGGKAIAVQADVSLKADVDKLIGKTLAEYGGRIDILINNAGSLVQRESIEETTEELWDRVVDVNLKSAYLCTHAVIPIMKEQGAGQIINVTSVAARNGGGWGSGHYSAAKAGMLALTKNLAKELIPYGIRVNAVSPGTISTRYHDVFSTPENRAKTIKTIPMQREGKSEECAYGVLFLASEYASFILGETMEINGGQFMH